MMQGDQYSVPFKISNGDGTPITAADVEIVEMMIGDIRKVWPHVGTFDATTNAFLFPIDQKESLGMMSTAQPVQARVYFKGGTVVGGRTGPVNIELSRSKEVLEVD